MLVNVHIPDEIAAAVKQYQQARTEAASLPVSFSRALTELISAGLSVRPTVSGGPWQPVTTAIAAPLLPIRVTEEMLHVFEEDRAAGGAGRLSIRKAGDKLAGRGILLGMNSLRGAARRLVARGHLIHQRHGVYELVPDRRPLTGKPPSPKKAP